MWQGLKIAFFGPSLVASHLNPHADYFRGIVRALHKLGHDITFYEPDIPNQIRQPDIANPYWAKVVTYPARDERDLYPLYTAANEADLIIKVSSVGIFENILNEMLLDLRTHNNLVIFWDVNPIQTLQEIRTNSEHPLRPLISRFDLILTFGDGDGVRENYKKLSAKQVETIYNALEPAIYFPVTENDRFACDLAFAGPRCEDNIARIRKLFFKPAKALPNHSFMLAGPSWQNRNLTANIKYLRRIYPQDYNAFNSTPKCLLNLTGRSGRDQNYAPPSDFFNAIGAGSCLLTDNQQKAERFLEPGKEILIANTTEQAIEQIQSISKAQAREIGNSARQHILAKHTYFHRAAQLERLIGASGVVREIAMC